MDQLHALDPTYTEKAHYMCHLIKMHSSDCAVAIYEARRTALVATELRGAN